MYYYFQNMKRLNQYQKFITTEYIGKNRRILRNLKRGYLKNIILKLRKYE